MNNEEEKTHLTVENFLWMVGFWGVCFYMRFFFDAPDSAKMPLNYILIVLGISLIGGVWMQNKQDTEAAVLAQKQAQIQAQAKADELRAEQEVAAKKRARQQELNRMIDEL